jgi:hypothetical protein
MNIPYQSILIKYTIKGIDKYAAQIPNRSCSLMSTREKYSRNIRKHKNPQIQAAMETDNNSVTINIRKNNQM